MNNLLLIAASFDCSSGDFNELFSVLNTLYTILMIAVPLLLIIFGIIDLAKAIMSGDEKKTKEAQGMLMKKLIVLVIVFLIYMLIKVVLNIVIGGENTAKITKCLDRVVNGN